MNEFSITIDADTLTTLVIGLQTAFDGLAADAFCLNVSGLLNHETNGRPAPEDWMIDHYEVVSGLVRLAAGVAGIIGSALLNDNLVFSGGTNHE